MVASIGILLSVLVLSSLEGHAQSALPLNYTIEGRLFDTSASPSPINNIVDIKLEVIDPAHATCVLYKEEHIAIDVTSSDSQVTGRFALKLGTGTNAVGTANLVNLFGTKTVNGDSNNDEVIDGADAACSFVPTAGGDRQVRVSVKINGVGSYSALNPPVVITSVPAAIASETLQGKTPNEFIQVNTTAPKVLSQANLESIFSTANFTELNALLGGTSTQYLKSNGGTVTGGIDMSSQVISNVGTPAAASDAVNKSYADSRLGGSQISNVAPTNGQVLLWNSSSSKWEAGLPVVSDATKLPLAGGTMSGPITMGGHDLFNTGHITMAAQTTLLLGRYTDVQESGLALGVADEGRIFYNTDQNALRVWNGTGYVGFGASGTAGGDLTGSYPNPSIGVGTVTTAKLADDAVTPAKVDNAGTGGFRLLMTDGTGSLLRFKTCAISEILQWTGAGWACVSVPTAMGTSGVIAGSYGSNTSVAAISVNAQGVVTAAADVAINFPVTSVAGKTGDVTLNPIDVGVTGTAALYDAGNAAGELPILDGTGKLNSSVLPNGTGTITKVTAGTGLVGGGTSGDVTLALDPANTDAYKIRGRDLSSTAPGADEVLVWNASTTIWEPRAIPSAPVSSVAGRTGAVTLTVADIGGAITQIVASAPLTGGGVSGVLTLGIDSTQIDAANIRGVNVSSVAPTSNQVLQYNGSGWVPTTLTDNAGVTYISTGTGLLGGNITATGTISVDVGTTPGQIVAVQAGNALPALDGSAVTNISNLKSVPISSTSPTLDQALVYNGSAWEAKTIADGDMTAVQTGTGLTGGGVTGGITISLANIAATSVLGNSGGAAAPPSAITFSAILNGALGTTQGSIAYHNGTNWVSLAPGSSGKVLSSQGAGANPQWVSAATGTVTYLNASTDFTLTGGPITSTGTININTANGNNQLLRLDAGGKVPASNLPSSIPAPGSDGEIVFNNGGNLATQSFLTWDSTNHRLGVNQSSPTFEIDTTGAGNFDGGISTFDGLEATPSYRFTTDGTSGMFRTATSTGISAGGKSALVVHNNRTATIGSTATAAPGVVLDIVGTGAISTMLIPRGTTPQRPPVDGTSVPGMIRYNTTLAKFEAYENNAWTNMITGTGTYLPLAGGTLTGGLTISSGSMKISAGNLDLNGGNLNNVQDINGAGQINVKSGTNNDVTIGNANGYSLAVRDQVGTGANYVFVQGDAGTGHVTVGAAGTTTNVDLHLLPKSAGMTGIGVPSTQFAKSTLEVMESTAAGSNVTLSLNKTTVNNGNVIGGIQFWANDTQTTGNKYYGSIEVQAAQAITTNAAAGNMLFYTTPVTVGGAQLERMRIDSAGRVGIGTTLNTAPGAILDVNGSGTVSAMIVPRDSTGARPTGTNGMIRYANDLGRFEVYENGAWQQILSSSSSFGDFKSDGSVAMTGQLLGYLGTAATPGYTFNGDANTGMWNAGADQLAFSTGGTERVRVDSSGFVGIGTGMPGDILDVWTNTNLSRGIVVHNNSAGPAGRAHFQAINDSGVTASFGVGSSGHTSLANRAFVQSSSGATGVTLVATGVGTDIRFLTSGNKERLRIDGNGIVGIGTTTPDSQTLLDAYGTGTLSNMIVPRGTMADRDMITSAQNGMLRYNTSLSKFEVYQNSNWSQLMTGSGSSGDFMANGSIPMTGAFRATDGGTGSPGITFNADTDTGIYRNSGGSGEVVTTYNGTSKLWVGTDILFSADLKGSGAGTFYIPAVSGSASNPVYSFNSDTDNGMFSPSADNIAFATDGIERLRVDPAGRVAIGTTAPVTGSILSLDGTGDLSSLIVPRDTSANRPVNGANGMIRYNTSLAKFEVYENDNWRNMSAVTAADFSGILPIANGGTGTNNGSITGSGNLTLASGGTNTNVVLKANGTGGVSIGTTSPQDSLHVWRSGSSLPAFVSSAPLGVLVQNSGNSSLSAGINIIAGDSGWAGFNFGGTSSGATPNAAIFHDNSSSNLNFYTGSNVSTPKMTLSSVGRLGIGSNSPTVPLDVVGTVSATTYYAANANGLFWGDGSSSIVGSGSSDMIQFHTNSSERMRINSNGWIGIGVTVAPSAPLHLVNSQAITSGTSVGVLFDSTFAPSAATAGGTAMYGLQNEIELNSAANNDNTQLIGAYNKAFSNATGGTPKLIGTNSVAQIDSFLTANLVGTRSFAVFTGDSYAPTVTGLETGVSVSGPGTGTVTTAKGIDIQLTNTNSTTTNAYGIYINDVSATNAYGIYQASADDKNYFAGTVGVGTTNPTAGTVMDINGTATMSSMLIPRNTTGNRPTTPQNGMIRYNTSLNKFEVYEYGWAQPIVQDSSGAAVFPGNVVQKTFSTSSGALDFNNGAIQITSFACGNFTFHNLREGGSYTIIATNTGTNMCIFPSSTSGFDALGSVTYKWMPANGPRTASTHTIYNLFRAGNIVYVTWTSGF